MQISQKRTCEGCRVLDDGQGSFMDCGLGYNNKGKYDSVLGMRITKPQEPCPKPKTYKERYEAEGKYRKSFPDRVRSGSIITTG